ncbi:hypothetical protein HDV00_007640 [Rhizophlyctis rosea]|nr:hypothetical protein HDV00_007640 [Rhizophlyctis rosea]
MDTNVDVLITIFASLPVPTLLRCEQVCRQWCNISRGEIAIWRPKLLPAYPLDCLPVTIGGENWRDVVCLWWAWARPWTPEVKVITPIFDGETLVDIFCGRPREALDIFTEDGDWEGLGVGNEPELLARFNTCSNHEKGPPFQHVRPPRCIRLPCDFNIPLYTLQLCGYICIRRFEDSPKSEVYDFANYNDGDQLPSPRMTIPSNVVAFVEPTVTQLYGNSRVTLCRLSDQKIIAKTFINFHGDWPGAFIMTRFNLIIRGTVKVDGVRSMNLKVYSLQELLFLYALPLNFYEDIQASNTRNVTFPEDFPGVQPRILDPMHRTVMRFKLR